MNDRYFFGGKKSMKFIAGTLLSVCLILLNSCDDGRTAISDITTQVGTHVAETQTASVWTATPVIATSTPIPNNDQIITILNNNIRSKDKLAELVEAKYHVGKLDFKQIGNSSVYSIMRIEVVCESMTRHTCILERGFVILIHGFESAFKDDDQRDTLTSQIPKTIQDLDVCVERDHAEILGCISLGWNDVKSYASGNLSPEQLYHEIHIIRQ